MTADASALMASMRFSPVDLEANRQGFLSQAQVERMKGIRRRNSRIAALFFVVLVVGATLLIYLGQSHRSAILSGAGILLVLVNAILIGAFGRSTMRVGGDLRAGNVDVLAGEVERVLRRSRGGDNYLLRINGAELYVSKDVFVGFQHESPYRIYRARFSGVLLSAESIG